MIRVVPRPALWRDPADRCEVVRWSPPPAVVGQVRLTVEPIKSREQAHALVRAMHRHFAKGPAADRARFVVRSPDGAIRGVAIVGSPTARMLDRRRTVEVTRVATDGTPNACSALLGACCRWAKAQGFERVITYTLESEGGASLRGAGFQVDGTTTGGGWARQDRERDERSEEVEGPKVRWVRTVGGAPCR